MAKQQQKNRPKVPASKTKQQKVVKVSPKLTKPTAGKKLAAQKKTKKVHKPIVFVSPKTDGSDEDNGEMEVEEFKEKAKVEKILRPSCLEPVPTDISDPQLPRNLQQVLRPLIGYVYNGDQMSLRLSFEQSGLLLQTDYDEATKVFRFIVNAKEMCQAVGEKAEAHTEARKKLVQIIRYYCYTVKRVKEFHTRRKIFYTRPPNPSKQEGTDKAIQEDNVGFKMLQKQGWAGGGLGTDEDGIVLPIDVKQRKGKIGLGADNATKDATNGVRSKKVKIPLEAFYMLMKQYAGVNALYDLVFSTQFTKQQVAILKGYATSLKLVPQMIGHQKRLVVSRPLTIKQIKIGVMKGHSDLCAKYVVIPPAAGIPEEDKTVLVKPRKEK